MAYTEQKIKINGLWRWVLVVSSTEPTTFADPLKIENGNTAYYTEGLYRAAEDNGKYYYWFIIMSKETKVIDTELLAEYERALNELGVQTQTDDEEGAADA